MSGDATGCSRRLLLSPDSRRSRGRSRARPARGPGRPRGRPGSLCGRSSLGWRLLFEVEARALVRCEQLQIFGYLEVVQFSSVEAEYLALYVGCDLGVVVELRVPRVLEAHEHLDEPLGLPERVVAG